MSNKKGLTISKVRGVLYDTAKVLGDIQAIKSGNPKKIANRIGRRVLGKESSKLMNKIFK